MEKMMMVLAFVFALALPVMGQQQDNQFSGFSLDDFKDLAGNSMEQAKQAAESLGEQTGITLDDVKQAAADFQNQAQAEGLTLEDVKQAAESTFQGATDMGGSSWMDWAKNKLKGFGFIDGADTEYGVSPSPAPAPGIATTTTANSEAPVAAPTATTAAPVSAPTATSEAPVDATTATSQAPTAATPSDAPTAAVGDS